MAGGAMPRVVVGLSGGVDSSIAAYMLKQQGYDVVGIYMRNWTETTGLAKSNCPFDEDVDFAMLVARRLAIPFEVWIFRNSIGAMWWITSLPNTERGERPTPMCCATER